ALENIPDGFTFDTYTYGEPPAGIDQVEFWVSSYDTPLPLDEMLPRMRSLRVLQAQTAGVEHVLPHVPDGVTLCNARGVHDAATAEMAMTLMLASIRGIPRLVDAQANRQWRHEVTGPALADSTVLIVGHGSIGAALEARLAGFECQVLKVARRPRPGVHTMDALPELLPAADVVVLLVPLTEQTHHLADKTFLAAMKDGALLVNLARGRVVDTEALLGETASGRLRAALDVTDPEPLPSDHRLW